MPEESQRKGYDPSERESGAWWQKGQLVLPPAISPHPGWVFPQHGPNFKAEIAAMVEKLAERGDPDPQYSVCRTAWEREDMIRQAEADPLNYGYEPKCWARADDQWDHAKELLLLGGNRCLAGEAMIYDPVQKTERPVSSIKGRHTVLAFDGSRLVPAEAHQPFEKASQDLFLVQTSAGLSFPVSGAHRVLGTDGKFCSVRELRPGSSIFLPESILDIAPELFPPDAEHSIRTVEDFQFDCPWDRRSDDGQLRSPQGTAQGVFPSRVDVRERISRFFSDGPDNRHGYSLSASCDLPSSLGDRLPIAVPSSDIEFLPAYTPCRSALQSPWDQAVPPTWQRWLPEFLRLRSTAGSVQRGNLFGRESACRTITTKITDIKFLRHDIVWDFHVPHFENYYASGAIHHNSSKTFYMAKRIMQKLVEHPNAICWCFQQTQEVSRRVQMPYIYNFIPDKWKKARKTKITNITYSKKTGFSEDAVVFPNGSMIVFKFYAQTVTTCEGPEVDVAWCDELVPLPFLETLEYRLMSANKIWPDGGRMFVSFTPVEGYSGTIKACLAGKTTLEETDAPLLKQTIKGREVIEKVPLVEQGPRGRIVYFHTSENPWSGYKYKIEKFLEKPREEILCRAYGVPTKPVGVQFPRFRNAEPYVFDDERIYEMLRGKSDKPPPLTWWHSCDPCAGRNWFQIWCACMADDTMVVVREHPLGGIDGGKQDWIPRIGAAGPWAKPGEKPDGDRGPAQRRWGFGINEYLDEIVRVEKEMEEDIGNPIELFDRIMDSRAANSPTMLKEGTTTLLEEVNDSIVENYPDEIWPEFDVAGGGHEKEGLDLINDRLAYDDSKPLSSANKPKLIIAASCTNTIFALSEYTGLDGQTGACKDPVDTLRYLIQKQAEFIGVDQLQTTGGGSY